MFESSSIVDHHMRNSLPVKLTANSVSFVYLCFFICLCLNELLLSKFYRLLLVSFSWKITLRIFDWFFKHFESLFVWIYEHLVVELKSKLHLRNCSQIERQVTMIASDSIENIQKFYPQLPHMNHMEHFF